MMWFRIDNRLIHGQVIEAWVPFIEAGALLVINDSLARDELQQMVISLAVPDRLKVEFLTLEQSGARCAEVYASGINAMVLFADCSDARAAFDAGVRMQTLNVGNLHFSPGKRQLCSHISLSSHDKNCLLYFQAHGIELDFRCIPNVPVVLTEWAWTDA